MGLDPLSLYDKFANLFALDIIAGDIFELPEQAEVEWEKLVRVRGRRYSYEGVPGSKKADLVPPIIKSLIERQFLVKLKRNGYRTRRMYRVYSPKSEVDHPNGDIFKVYQGFRYRILYIGSQLFLAVDPAVIFETTATIQYLLKKGLASSKAADFSVRYREKYMIDGYLLTTIETKEGVECKVRNYREFKEDLVPADAVYPEPRADLMEHILVELNRVSNVNSLQRKLSFLDSKTASKDRLSLTLQLIQQLQDGVFPLQFGNFRVALQNYPAVVKL